MRKADYFSSDKRANNISGCVNFVGEDVEEEERMRQNQKANREALFMLMEENKQK